MTKANDRVFIYNNIHQAFPISKPKLIALFAKHQGWKIVMCQMIDPDTMELEYTGKKDDGEAELMPDFGTDLEALRPAFSEGKLIVGPEYSWFEEWNRMPVGWAVYGNWIDISLDYIDRLGYAKALAISNDLNSAIMLGWLVKKAVEFKLEDLA